MSLENWGHYSAIGSFILAIIASSYALFEYGKYTQKRNKKRRTLEKYLSQAYENRGEGNQGMHTVLHCKCELGLTEDEITDIVFSSEKVKFYKSIDPETKKVVDLVVGDSRCTPKSQLKAMTAHRESRT